MKNVLMLMRREVWEHRSLWTAPVAVAILILIIALLGGVHVGSDDFNWTFQDEGARHDMRQFVPPEDVRVGIIAGMLSMLTVVQLVVIGIVVFFYLLDALYTERRDRSILFWKSLPVSDGEVVTSKALTGLVAAPLFVLAVSAVTQLLFAGIAAIRLGDLPFVPWDTLIWLKLQVAQLGFVATVVLWYLPIAGYLMLVSVWARKNAFLWAVLPWVVLLVLEGVIMQGMHVAEFLVARFGGFVAPMSSYDAGGFDHTNMLGSAFHQLGKVFADGEIWIGVLAGTAMIYAATRIRRYRDDS